MKIRPRGGARALALVVAVALLAVAAPASATTAKVGPPTRVTALGDSITRGYDSQGSGCGTLADCPAFNWATGTNTNVNSYYRRLQALNPSVALSNPTRLNDAVTGAKVADLNGQAIAAIAGDPDLVLIEIGANDVCTSSEGAMTSVADFRTRFQTAMNTLSTQLPDARIQVLSIPNIWNLWNVLRTNFLAQLVWGAGGICQSMLASPTSMTQANVDRRARVQQRNIDFNTQLKQVCAEYIHCRYDNGATYGLVFASSDVSTLDYFHPNTNGQAKAAQVAWNNRFDYSDTTAPTTTITRDRDPDGVNDWYKDDVRVSLAATDANSPVAGTEFFYKLAGADDQAWTKYTGPFTIDDEGVTDVVARSVDVNGNIEAAVSDAIKIDKTPPTFTLACTSSLLNGAASATISDASDNLSGFLVDPNGSTSLPTSSVGSFTYPAQVQDQAGNTTDQSCAFDVQYGFGGVLQPINRDGSSVFKLGSTVPVKFQVTDAAGALLDSAAATLSVVQVSGSVEGTDVEAVSTSTATVGSAFRYDADARQYIFNLSTKSLSKGTWRAKIQLDDGTVRSASFSLK